MGREQYSSPEAEAIASIDQSVEDLEIVVDELKNTDVANISTSIANLSSFEEYTKFKLFEASSAGEYTVLTTIFEVIGKGYIDMLAIAEDILDLEFELYLDDNLIMSSGVATKNYLWGYFLKSRIINSGTALAWDGLGTVTFSGANSFLRCPGVDYLTPIDDVISNPILNISTTLVVDSIYTTELPLFFENHCELKIKSGTSNRGICMRGGVE